LTPEPAAVIRAGLSGLNLSPLHEEQFEAYLSLLLRWNARINLTAVRDPEEIVRRHFRECIFVARLIPPGVRTLLDFGSGAGLPGIPIAICRPEIQVTLAESQGKKASFLREAVRTLHLTAAIRDGRVETMAEGRVFDAVVLRAVDSMEEACRLAAERLDEGGWIAAFATRATEDALARVPAVLWTGAVDLPNTDRGVILTGRRAG
jgi:16S rRNA (guanine527-N7)-methyltransferase